MKHNDPKKSGRKNFLRIPTFPGGKDAYLQFIRDNIVYPEKALVNQVEGLVYVTFSVDNIGDIIDIEVTKGIGYGCDEEAIRVIRLMKYEPARNRGIKMKAEMKTRIEFKLPKPNSEVSQGFQLNYSNSTTAKSNSPEPKPQAVYNYSIKLG